MLILAWDSLEPTLTEKWDFQQLQQTNHGKTIINVHPLTTPTIWTTFLTGLKPETHGVHGFHSSRWPLIKQLYLKTHLNQISEHTVKSNVGFARLLDRLGIKLSLPSIQQQNLDTIFTDRKHETMDVPCWDPCPLYNHLRMALVQSLGNTEKTRTLLKTVKQYYRKKEQKLLHLLENIDVDTLFMVHFLVSDTVQHLYWYEWKQKYKPGLFQWYQRFNDTTRTIKQTYPGQILIVSDHGQQHGVHTDRGFWSTNFHTTLNTPEITDYYTKIRKWTR